VALKAAALANGYSMVDLYSLMAREHGAWADWGATYTSDPPYYLHPNDAGHDEYARLIVEEVFETAEIQTLDQVVAALPTAAENATAVDSALSAAHGAGSWATATSVTVSDKTGFKLASDGLATVTAWTVNVTGSLSGSVGSVVGHTPQTGDAYALAAGSNGFAAIKSDTAAILLDTGTDGVVVSPASKTGYSLAGTITTFDGLASALASAHGAGSWEGSGGGGIDPRGPGATQWTPTITVGGVPLADADVWVTTDAAGTDVVAGTLRTNTAGRAGPFLLDAGVVYYLWAQKNGYNAIVGEQFTCEAD
jgi:hypothetical protein